MLKLVEEKCRGAELGGVRGCDVCSCSNEVEATAGTEREDMEVE